MVVCFGGGGGGSGGGGRSPSASFENLLLTNIDDTQSITLEDTYVGVGCVSSHLTYCRVYTKGTLLGRRVSTCGTTAISTSTRR